MRKIIFTLLIFFCFFSQIKVLAAPKDFSTTANSTYTVSDTGNTHVSETITITNKTKYLYTSSYIVTFGYANIYGLTVSNSEGPLAFMVEKNGNNKTITITFQKRITGIGKSNTFMLTYDTDSIAKKEGLVWEIDIPGLTHPEDYSSNTVMLTVPDSFGTPDSIKPEQFSQKNPTTYIFSNNEAMGKAGIYMIFGNMQYYTFNLSYHLANSNLFPIKSEIALPPSTNYQDVSIGTIDPPPLNVYQDTDGNWLAVYSLNSQQKLTIHAKGVVRVFSKPTSESLTSTQQTNYMKSQQFWNTNNSQIVKIVQTIKTPEQIYDYVVKTLTYNYNKVSDTSTRIGAVGVLANPTNAVCLEFSDLFVTLARAAHIPSRIIEGYAYTQNSTLRPVSLANDILHAWPEYYDSSKQAWVMVDPTWGNTTKGLDYFHSLDENHIAFVINGSSSTYPIPAGGYKISPNSRDIDVSFATAADFRENSKTLATVSLPAFHLSSFPVNAIITLKNIGSVPLENKTLTVISDLKPSQQTFSINEVPPYGSDMISVNLQDPSPFDTSSLLTNKIYHVTILFDGNTIHKVIRIGLLPELPTLLEGGGILLAGAIISLITIKARRLFVQKR